MRKPCTMSDIVPSVLSAVLSMRRVRRDATFLLVSDMAHIKLISGQAWFSSALKPELHVLARRELACMRLDQSES